MTDLGQCAVTWCECHGRLVGSVSLQKKSQSLFLNHFQKSHTQRYDSRTSALVLSCSNLMLHTLPVTHQPTLNSTWASNRATTGAVAALHPLTLDRIKPSCLACRTILMNPGRWLLVSDTKSCSFSFSSSTKHTDAHEFYIHIWGVFEDLIWDRWVRAESCLWTNFHPQDVVMSSFTGQYFIGPKVLMLHCFDHWTKEAAAWASAADLHGAYQS